MAVINERIFILQENLDPLEYLENINLEIKKKWEVHDRSPIGITSLFFGT